MTKPDRRKSIAASSRSILAIECSTPKASVAIRNAAGTVVEQAVPTGDRTVDRLPPSIDRLIRDAGLDRGDLGGIAVSEGPGGFTGLRVSVALAKGIAEALRIPTLGVSSAAVAAESTLTAEDSRVAMVVMATKRGTAWVETVFRDEVAGRRVSRGGRIVDVHSAREAALFDAVEGRVVLADERQDREIVAALTGDPAVELRPRHSAGALVELAERAADDEWDDPARLLVRYPRVPEAVTLWNAQRGDR
ncbi:MAG: tRNA (adenosine(37)-N6)-threonylcarbamoyltransferase complex dimerization subunit type 1 TsaB [Planctomycetota bacterium]|jgi:tRNA threonylcarbamoyl adenosine modification protein YeaZ